MIYLPDQHLCFLRIQKTAGTWMSIALRGSGLRCLIPDVQHYANNKRITFRTATLEQGKDISFLPSDLSSIQFVAFVRHPFSWLRSYWVDRQLNGWGGDLRIGHTCKSDDFTSFVLAVCQKHPGFVTAIFERYTGPFADTLHAPQLKSLVFKSEDIRWELLALLDKHASGKFDRAYIETLEIINAGAALPAFREKTEGDQALWRLVREKERRIYECFGYEVQPPPHLSV